MAAIPPATQGNLLDAIRRGESGDVKRLLNAGADPNVADAGGRTASHYAALSDMQPYRRREILGDLIRMKADLNRKDVNGRTALHEAATRGDAETCAALVRAGATVDAQANDGTTPLFAAMRAAITSGKMDCMKALIDHGANSLIRDKQGKTALDQSRAAFGNFYASVQSFLADWETNKSPERRNRDFDGANKDDQKRAAEETLKKLQAKAKAGKPKFKP